MTSPPIEPQTGSPYWSVLNTPTATEISAHMIYGEQIQSLTTKLSSLTLTVEQLLQEQSAMKEQLCDKDRTIESQKLKLQARKNPGKRERALARNRSGSPYHES